MTTREHGLHKLTNISINNTNKKNKKKKRFIFFRHTVRPSLLPLSSVDGSQTYVIYAGRLLCGLSLGAVTVAVPLYTHDVAPDACRGRGGVFLDLMLCAGVLYSYTVSSVAGLQTFSFTCAAVPVAFVALFAAMPESPRSLYGRGRYADAKSALMYVPRPLGPAGTVANGRAEWRGGWVGGGGGGRQAAVPGSGSWRTPFPFVPSLEPPGNRHSGNGSHEWSVKLARSKSTEILPQFSASGGVAAASNGEIRTR